jgi:hypothetical protein
VTAGPRRKYAFVRELTLPDDEGSLPPEVIAAVLISPGLAAATDIDNDSPISPTRWRVSNKIHLHVATWLDRNARFAALATVPRGSKNASAGDFGSAEENTNLLISRL